MVLVIPFSVAYIFMGLRVASVFVCLVALVLSVEEMAITIKFQVYACQRKEIRQI